MKTFNIALLVFLAITPITVKAAPELVTIQKQIKQTEQQHKKIEQQLETSNRDINQTKKKLVKAADQVSNLEEQRGLLSKKISDLDIRRIELEQDLIKNKSDISDAAASILFIASNPTFNTDTTHDYVLTTAILSSAADRFDIQIQDATKKLQEIEKIREARAIEKEKLDRTAKRYANEKNELDKLLKTRSAQNKKLKTQQIEIQNKLKLLSEKAKSISELSAGVGSSEMSSDSRFSKRKLNTPVRGRLIVHFAEKTALGLKSDGWRIKTRDEALVMAPADGIVKFADSFRGFGKIIIMSHKNGYNTVMTNMGSIDTLVGQEVLAGEPIGRMGSTKTEMYLEVRRGDKAIDPANLFNEP